MENTRKLHTGCLHRNTRMALGDLSGIYPVASFKIKIVWTNHPYTTTKNIGVYSHTDLPFGQCFRPLRKGPPVFVPAWVRHFCHCLCLSAGLWQLKSISWICLFLMALDALMSAAGRVNLFHILEWTWFHSPLSAVVIPVACAPSSSTFSFHVLGHSTENSSFFSNELWCHWWSSTTVYCAVFPWWCMKSFGLSHGCACAAYVTPGKLWVVIRMTALQHLSSCQLTSVLQTVPW